MPSRPLTEFGRYLEQLLADRALSLRGFARLVQTSPGWVSRVKRLTIAPEHIEPWADALQLRGDERERFIRLAWLTHAPPFVRAYVATLERAIAEAAQCRAPTRRKK